MHDLLGALAGIGDTPLVQLRNVTPASGARIVAKLEWANPTGSMKDRMARTAIAGAIRDGRLYPGVTVVEYTAGTTGISLAFVCAALGYPLHIVFSDAFSVEKRRTMEAFGAVVEEVPSNGGQITEALIKSMIARAGQIAAQPGHWWCDQLNNRDAITGYLALGDEIWPRRTGRSTSSSTRLAPRTRCVASDKCCGPGTLRYVSLRWNRPSLQCCQVGPRDRIGSKGSASALSLLCGNQTRSTTSSRSAPMKRWPWRDGLHVRRDCSPERRRGRMWWRRCGSLSNSAPTRP